MMSDTLQGLILIVKAKCRFTLANSYSSCDFDDIVIEGFANVVEIREDKCFAHVEAYSNNILGIFARELLYVLDS